MEDADYFEGSAAEWGNEADGGAQDDEDGEGEDDAEVQQECLKKFSTPDYIMEPSIFNTLKRYFQAGGSPENVIQLLSENYTAVAQTVNLLAEWLIQTGVEPVQVQETVENHLKSLLIKHFDPRKADSIFTEEGETPAWLEQMIAHTTWRDLFYKLAEAHPDCLMLNFTVKVVCSSVINETIHTRLIVLASDVGYDIACISYVYLLILLIQMSEQYKYISVRGIVLPIVNVVFQFDLLFEIFLL